MIKKITSFFLIMLVGVMIYIGLTYRRSQVVSPAKHKLPQVVSLDTQRIHQIDIDDKVESIRKRKQVDETTVKLYIHSLYVVSNFTKDFVYNLKGTTQKSLIKKADIWEYVHQLYMIFTDYELKDNFFGYLLEMMDFITLRGSFYGRFRESAAIILKNRKRISHEFNSTTEKRDKFLNEKLLEFNYEIENMKDIYFNLVEMVFSYVLMFAYNN